jgi:AraC family ethanolamine operon transcriptional activator
MLKSPPGVARQFTTLVHRFLTAAESRPQLLDSPNAIASVQNELLASVKQLFMTSQHSASRHYERWREQTMSATEVALKEPELGMVVSEASTHLGVPERTLRAAFQSCYGLSPVKYLRILRLHQARHLLLTHCPDQTSVTQIASEVGFWELGRFSRDYRKLFGELPSETLRKPIRKGHP